MKKFLKGLAAFFLIIGIIVYTAMLFTENLNDEKYVLIFMDVLFLFLLWLLFRKRKPKAKNELPAITLNPNGSGQTPIKTAISVPQAKDQVRILNDCLNIIEKTKNLETFFSRYELGMTSALTIQQAQQQFGVNSETDLPTTFFKTANEQKTRVLFDSFWDQKDRVDKLTSPKSKINQWQRYLSLLEQFEDQYSFEFQTEYSEVVDKVLQEIQKNST